MARETADAQTPTEIGLIEIHAQIVLTVSIQQACASGLRSPLSSATFSVGLADAPEPASRLRRPTFRGRVGASRGDANP